MYHTNKTMVIDDHLGAGRPDSLTWLCYKCQEKRSGQKFQTWAIDEIKDSLCRDMRSSEILTQ